MCVREIIRTCELKDATALTRFNIAMAAETEGKRLDHDTVAAGVRGLLANPAEGFYLIAQWDGETVAGLMVTYEWSDWRNQRFWWIQSVYVLPTHRREGIFTRLHQTVQTMAESRDEVCGLRLYVERNNTIAKATYNSLGMVRTNYDMYETEF